MFQNVSKQILETFCPVNVSEVSFTFFEVIKIYISVHRLIIWNFSTDFGRLLCWKSMPSAPPTVGHLPQSSKIYDAWSERTHCSDRYALVHDRPLNLVCPDVPRTVGETFMGYGWCLSNRIWSSLLSSLLFFFLLICKPTVTSLQN